ncbi:ferrous iron transport protein B [Candidatus Solincola tengchongensis]|uniref:ferrous iron transport protein B n=1 Tax=Candidatus Solincola tengchongensis TaxID=2900693 RepID=UPI00257F792A|nr:ferrous iron transport protein B [Candidatus Solincola tengchongensis]
MHPLEELERLRSRAEFIFALAGNPNVGKSTIFGRITGMGVMTANYPGMTVELNLALTEFEGRRLGIVDLPGTYALGAVSEDQLVARRGVLQGRPDVVIVILDANNLARNLYLLLQFLDLGCPIVAALNLVDQAEKSGIRTDVQLLSEYLGVPVVPTVGVRGDGLNKLIAQAVEVAERREEYPVIPFSYAMDIESRLRRLARRIQREVEETPYGISPRALAILLLEEDREFVEWMEEREEGRGILEFARRLAAEIEREHGESAPVILARERHGIAGSIAEGVQARSEYRKPLWGERLWEYTTSFKTGLPIMILVMGAVFTVLFWGGGQLASLFARFWENLVSGPLGRALESALGANLLSRTIIWGVDGLGAILEIALPYLLVFYVILAAMEDSGYLNAVAFLTDRLMHRLGLHGRAVIPLISAVGCNVPAVMGTRVLSTRRERIIACALIVLVPCSARVAVIMGGVARFLGWPYAMLLFAIIIILVLGAGLLLNRLLPGESTGLVMEMFPFRVPSPATMAKKTWLRIKDFLYIAAPLIVAGSVLLGILYESGWIEHLLGPLRPLTEWWLGIPAVAGLALILGFLRKELALALLVVLAARVIPGVTESSTLLDFMTRGQVFTFVLVCAVYIPCVATLAVLWRELGARDSLLVAASTVLLALLLGGLSHLVIAIL